MIKKIFKNLKRRAVYNQMQAYYDHSPRFRLYVDRCCKTYKTTVSETLKQELVHHVARYYQDQDAMETGRHPKNRSTYTPMGECV